MTIKAESTITMYCTMIDVLLLTWRLTFRDWMKAITAPKTSSVMLILQLHPQHEHDWGLTLVTGSMYDTGSTSR